MKQFVPGLLTAPGGAQRSPLSGAEAQQRWANLRYAHIKQAHVNSSSSRPLINAHVIHESDNTSCAGCVKQHRSINLSKTSRVNTTHLSAANLQIRRVARH